MTSIRTMRIGDAAAVADLATQLGYPVTADEVVRRIASLLVRDDHLLLVATDEGDAAAGWIHVHRQLSLQEPARAVIGGLVVGDGYRDAGIGTALVAAGESWALDGGLDRIVVRSRSTRTRAHRFYERIGYRETKHSHVFEKRFV